MTVLEFLKTASIDEIVEEVLKGKDNVHDICDWRLIILNSFSCEVECPEDCKHYDDSHSYEDTWLNGCCLVDYDACPYNINKIEVLKKEIKDWLNSDIK